MVALADQVIRLAQRRPALMVVEDIHWVDPSTLELLHLMPERVRGAPVLMLLTHRPEFASPWANQEQVSTLNLNRLSRRLGVALVEQVTRSKPLPTEVLEQILTKTDCVPLFVEELTQNILESGFLKETPERYELAGPLPALAIPTSLQDSLMARLDRLGATKEIAQIGARIGREFNHELLTAVSPLAPVDFDRGLKTLTDSGLLFRRTTGTETLYTFKHALVQDCAYESLLKSRRQSLHEHIARALQAKFADQIKTQPELLALHLTKAGRYDDAAPQWLAAAQFAAMGTRYKEALDHVASGLAIIEQVSDTQHADLEVALLVTGAFCHFSATGYGSIPAADMLARVESLLDRVTSLAISATALWAIGVHAWVRANFQKAVPTCERLALFAKQGSDTSSRILAEMMLGAILRHVCEFERGRAHLQFALENYDLQRDLVLIHSIGHDIKVNAAAHLGMQRLDCGFADEARRLGQLAIAHAESIAHPFSLSEALSLAALNLAELGDIDNALTVARRCIALCDAQNMPYWKVRALVTEGICLVTQRQYAEGIAKLEFALDNFSGMGSLNGHAIPRAWKAIALANLGQFEEARRETDLGAEECRRNWEPLWLSTALHARGLVEQLDPNAESGAAERWFNEAITEARTRGNRWIELRAANSLVRLWQSQGKREEALELLQPIYDWFTEGFDALDLKEAASLLKELQTQ